VPFACRLQRDLCRLLLGIRFEDMRAIGKQSSVLGLFFFPISKMDYNYKLNFDVAIRNNVSVGATIGSNSEGYIVFGSTYGLPSM
jgi:hypothetical protein